MMQAQEIFDAVKRNDLAKVKELIEKDLQRVQSKDQQGYSLLNQACNLGHIEIINFLIDKGANINLSAGRLDLTPLMECARTGNLEVAKLLVEKGADVQIINKMGMSALSQNIEVYQKILKPYPDTDLGFPTNPGDRFHYKKGNK